MARCAWLPAALVAAACCPDEAVARASPYESAQPEAGGGRPVHVGFLVLDGVYNTELTAPWDVFHHSVFRAREMQGDMTRESPAMRVFSVAPRRRQVESFEGLDLVPDFSFEDAPQIDVLVVPSAHHNMDTDLEDEELIEWVRRVGGQADFVLSLCDGAFVLAEAGLLDGLEATTFPGDLDAFEQRYGARLAAVHRDVSFVHGGKAITSAGGALSFEAALYLHDLYFGAEATRRTARGLVIDWDLAAVAHVVVEGARRP